METTKRSSGPSTTSCWAGGGAGVGLGKEVQMMLGKDCAVRAIEVRDGINHMMETFGDICNNVDVD